MKKQKSTLAILLSCIMIFTSCHNENMNFSVHGNGEIKLSSIAMTYNAEPIGTVDTWTEESRAIDDLSNYTVGIYGYNDNTMVQEWKYSEMPEIFVLPAGEYKVTAHSPEIEGAQFDAPYCYGESKKIEIKKDNVSDVGEIVCTLKSIKVTIVFSDDLKPLLDDNVNVTVNVGQESLVYTKDNTLSGYFHGNGDATVVNVVFSGNIEGEPASITSSYTVAEGNEIIVKYNLMTVSTVDPGTGATFSHMQISVNNEILSHEDINESVLPGNDEILDFGSPSIEGVGFDIKQPITDLTQEVRVNLKAPEGMAHVVVGISSTSDVFTGAVTEVFKGHTTFDLAYPPTDEVKNVLVEFGFPVGEQIIGVKDVVVFDVTQFIGLLGDESFMGIHTFKITVEDAFGDQAVESLVIDSRK